MVVKPVVRMHERWLRTVEFMPFSSGKTEDLINFLCSQIFITVYDDREDFWRGVLEYGNKD